ncbi:DUF2807 domain-containing protein [Chryseobacterium sp. POL2]|uniref:GIN domain-containing protein n=1 Tax=Chryseobacterium sp. POL2 TaxID=2713414 RepID=UPI0013E1EED1|nr:DUF2807 domain-containing protein [Chryseobacterium sp. POL2]QIG88924.1 DUF2807 domain-containing protein [Chryseobacterium sp. POL2]
MKNFVVLMLSMLTLVSCGNIEPKGDIVAKDVELSEFDKLDAKGKFRLFYVESPHNFVTVETTPNFFDNLEINVSNKVLNIKEKRPTEKIGFYNLTIYGKHPFDDVKLADSVELNISSQMKVNDFKLTLQDQSKFIGAVISQKAWVNMTQKSRANLLGKSDLAYVKTADTASIISPYWFVNSLELDAKNNTYTEVNVDEEIKGSVTDTSKLVYYGNPSKKIKVTEKATMQNKVLN